MAGEHYTHTQRGVLHYLMACFGAACLVPGFLAGTDSPIFIVYVGTAGVLMVLAASLVYLRVVDEGDALSVAFGPVRLFATSIPYCRIESVEPDTLGFWDGWGLQGFPGFRAIFRVSGKDCVRVDLKERIGFFRFNRVYIGTDEPERLADFLESRISDSPTE